MENQAFSKLSKKISRKGFVVMFNFRQLSVFRTFVGMALYKLSPL